MKSVAIATTAAVRVARIATVADPSVVLPQKRSLLPVVALKLVATRQPSCALLLLVDAQKRVSVALPKTSVARLSVTALRRPAARPLHREKVILPAGLILLPVPVMPPIAGVPAPVVAGEASFLSNFLFPSASMYAPVTRS